MVYKLTIRNTLRFLIVYNYSHKLLFSKKKNSNILALKFIYFLNLYFVVFFLRGKYSPEMSLSKQSFCSVPI